MISRVMCLGSVSIVVSCGGLVGIVGSEARTSCTYWGIVGFSLGRRVLLVTMATRLGGILGGFGGLGELGC